MSEWSVLGIAPTRDEDEIRRAYVRLLKQHRPDRDPEGYQRLREAWEQAKRYAASEPDEPQVFATNAQAEEAGLAQTAQEEGAGCCGNGDSVSRVDATTADDGASASLAAQFLSPDGSDNSSYSGDDRRNCADEWSAMALDITPPPVFTPQDIHLLAHRLLESELCMAQLEESWQRVAASGSLMQQQQFHQQLAQALVERPGLTGELLMSLSEALGWGLEGYDNGNVLPDWLVWQLDSATRQTEVEANWQALLRSAGDSWRKRRMVALIAGSDEKMPFWARLIPNFLSDMNNLVAGLCDRYPELTERINPVVRQCSQEKHVALSWAGVFLLLFWGVVLNRSAVAAHPEWPVLTFTGVLILFYLYGHELIFLQLRRWTDALTVWLLIEGLFSVLILILFFVLMHFGIPKLLGNRTGLAGVVEIILALIVCSGGWRIRQRGGPFIFLPGKLIHWLLAAPWNAPRAIPSRLLAIIVGLMIYFGSCAAVYEFFRLINNVMER